VKTVGRKRLIKETVAAIGVALLLGGIVAAPATMVLTLYFPNIDLMPIFGNQNFNFTQFRIVPPGQMSFVGVYLNYGDSMVGFYSSNIRVNAYIMDVFNFYNYEQGATFFTPIIKGLPSASQPFAYTASAPGFYYLVIENYSPYPAFVAVEGASVSNIVLPRNNLGHTLSVLFLYISLTGALIGAILYLPLRAWESRTSKKRAKKKKVVKKQ
jgi:hypothetical protein